MAYTPPIFDDANLDFAPGTTPPFSDFVLLEFGTPPATNSTFQVQSTRGTASAFFNQASGQTLQVQSTEAFATQLRDPVIGVRSRLRTTSATPTDLRAVLPFGTADLSDQRTEIRWTGATPRQRRSDIAWAGLSPQDRKAQIPITDTAREQHRRIFSGMPWLGIRAQDIRRTTHWNTAKDHHNEAAGLPWNAPPPKDRRWALNWERARKADLRAVLATGHATAHDLRTVLPWDTGTVPPHRYVPRPPIIDPPAPPPAPCYTPPPPFDVYLDFVREGYRPPDPHNVALEFVCNPGGYGAIFRIHRSLRVSHTLQVLRLPDRQVLNVTAVSMSIDQDSFAWSFQIQFADRASLLAVAPTPGGVTSVEIQLDGYTWTALIESYREDRSLASSRANSRGRSRTALLARPYAPERSHTNSNPATAQQLALQELEFTGFELLWNIDDWTVPAGAFSYQRLSPLSAIALITRAAGATLQADPELDRLIINPRYPTLPWQVGDATPAQIIAPNVWVNRGKTYLAGPEYQGVYVSGRDQGVIVNVYRLGTPGTPYAEMVVDPLITETAAGVQRGQSIIADAYTREEITLLLPMTPKPQAPGLLTPGTLIEVQDTTWGTYRAKVTGCSLEASTNFKGALVARQSVTIERYLDPL